KKPNVTQATPVTIIVRGCSIVSARPSTINSRLPVSTRARPNVSAMRPDHAGQIHDEDRADLRLVQAIRRREQTVTDVVVQRDEAAHQHEAEQEQQRQSGPSELPEQRSA